MSKPEYTPEDPDQLDHMGQPGQWEQLDQANQLGPVDSDGHLQPSPPHEQVATGEWNTRMLAGGQGARAPRKSRLTTLVAASLGLVLATGAVAVGAVRMMRSHPLAGAYTALTGLGEEFSERISTTPLAGVEIIGQAMQRGAVDLALIADGDNDQFAAFVEIINDGTGSGDAELTVYAETVSGAPFIGSVFVNEQEVGFTFPTVMDDYYGLTFDEWRREAVVPLRSIDDMQAESVEFALDVIQGLASGSVQLVNMDALAGLGHLFADVVHGMSWTSSEVTYTTAQGLDIPAQLIEGQVTGADVARFFEEFADFIEENGNAVILTDLSGSALFSGALQDAADLETTRALADLRYELAHIAAAASSLRFDISLYVSDDRLVQVAVHAFSLDPQVVGISDSDGRVSLGSLHLDFGESATDRWMLVVQDHSRGLVEETVVEWTIDSSPSEVEHRVAQSQGLAEVRGMSGFGHQSVQLTYRSADWLEPSATVISRWNRANGEYAAGIQGQGYEQNLFKGIYRPHEGIFAFYLNSENYQDLRRAFGPVRVEFVIRSQVDTDILLPQRNVVPPSQWNNRLLMDLAFYVEDFVAGMMLVDF